MVVLQGIHTSKRWHTCSGKNIFISFFEGVSCAWLANYTCV